MQLTGDGSTWRAQVCAWLLTQSNLKARSLFAELAQIDQAPTLRAWALDATLDEYLRRTCVDRLLGWGERFSDAELAQLCAGSHDVLHPATAVLAQQPNPVPDAYASWLVSVEDSTRSTELAHVAENPARGPWVAEYWLSHQPTTHEDLLALALVHLPDVQRWVRANLDELSKRWVDGPLSEDEQRRLWEHLPELRPKLARAFQLPLDLLLANESARSLRLRLARALTLQMGSGFLGRLPDAGSAWEVIRLCVSWPPMWPRVMRWLTDPRASEGGQHRLLVECLRRDPSIATPWTKWAAESGEADGLLWRVLHGLQRRTSPLLVAWPAATWAHLLSRASDLVRVSALPHLPLALAREFEPRLRELSTTRSAWLAVAASATLARLGDLDAVARLESIRDSGGYQLRAFALQHLTELGHFPTLDLLEDRDRRPEGSEVWSADVVEEWAYGLAKANTPEGLQAVVGELLGRLPNDTQNHLEDLVNAWLDGGAALPVPYSRSGRLGGMWAISPEDERGNQEIGFRF